MLYRIWRNVLTYVLAVRDDELYVGDNERKHMHGFGCPTQRNMASPLRVSGQAGGNAGDLWETECAKKLCNTNFYCYICVLLVKTILMIYICYIKYRECGNMCACCQRRWAQWVAMRMRGHVVNRCRGRGSTCMDLVHDATQLAHSGCPGKLEIYGDCTCQEAL